jgi:hypothetical protein
MRFFTPWKAQERKPILKIADEMGPVDEYNKACSGKRRIKVSVEGIT